MQKVKIITERISSLSYDFANKNDIYLIPTNVIWDEKNFKDDNDVQNIKLLKKLENSENLPTTAVPSYGEMKEYFEEAVKENQEGIYISTSSKLSGLYNLGLKVSKDLRDRKIHIYDSEATVSVEGMISYEASQMAKKGFTCEEIIVELDKLKKEEKIKEYGTLETLKYLEKGGRIGKAKALLANLFSFKPIISLKDGLLEPIGRVRTQAQAIESIFDNIQEDINRLKPKKISVMFDVGLNQDFVKNSLTNQLKEKFKI